MGGGRENAYLPTPTLPVGKPVETNVGDNLQGISTQGKDVDLVRVVNAVASRILDAFKVQHKVRIRPMSPSPEGKREEVEIRDWMNYELPQFLSEDRNWNALGCIDARVPHSLTSQALLVLGEVDGACIRWRVGHGDEGNEALAYSDGAGNDEEPLPAGETVNTVHVAKQSGLQGSKKHRAGNIADCEAGDSDGKLGGGVPVEYEGDNAWPEGR